MKKKVLYRLLAFALLFAAGAAFVFIVGTYRYLSVETYPIDPIQTEFTDTTALLGDRAAGDCGINADSELFIDAGIDVEEITAWLDECRPEILIIFLECTSSRELNARLDSMSLLLSKAVSRAGTVYVMAAPPLLEEECTADFRPMYVRQNNHALTDLAERYGAVYIEEHTVNLAVTKGTLAPEYCGVDSYFSAEGSQLVRDVLAKYI